MKTTTRHHAATRRSGRGVALLASALLPCAALATEPLLEYIPGGEVLIGDASPGDPGEGLADERPKHVVSLPPVYMENLEVTKALWDEVRAWALTNGYPDLAEGRAGGGTNGTPDASHPVTAVSWYDCVKWCNARSEQEGLSPVYHVDGITSSVYRTGALDLSNACMQAAADGYRLPTETEWEAAARGGLVGQFYPWPGAGGSYADHLGSAHANGFDSESPTGNGTRPAGSLGNANGFRLYDMAGNAAEWCWDWYSADDYTSASAPASLGPDRKPAGACRTVRGGSWMSNGFELRCAFRDHLRPADTNDRVGLRCVRGFAGNEDIDRDGDGMPDWWECTFFADPTNAPPAGDPDGDGSGNREECIADTNPTNAASVFCVEDLSGPGSAAVLWWRSVSNRLYSVWQATSLHAGFTVLASNLPATPPLNAYTDTVHGADAAAFYRVRVREPE